MASFTQNQSRQYKPYTPEVDTQVYAAALQHKDLEYKEGAKKVEQFNSIAGHIPVARPTDQKYVQGIANNITSQLNQKIGESGDLSDQRLVNNLGVMASTLANDSTIQTIVANTSKAKNYFSEREEDTKRTKGANVANEYVGDKQYQSWYNNEDPKTDLDAKYTNYTDANKIIDDQMVQLHPEIKQILSPGKGKSTDWELSILQTKGVDHAKALKELHEIIETNPGVKTQMAINAQYTMKDYTGEDHKQDLFNENLLTYTNNIKAIGNLDSQLTSAKTQNERDLINSQKNALDKEQSFIQNFDYNKHAALYDHNPDYKNEMDNRLYEDKFLNQKLDLYTSGREETWKFEGMSPMQQAQQTLNAQHWGLEFGLQKQANARASREEDRKIAKDKHDQAIDDATDHVYTPKELDQATMVGTDVAWSRYISGLEEDKKQWEGETKDWLYEKYSNAPGVDVNKYFTVDNSTGQTVISFKPGMQDMVMKTFNDYLKNKRKGNYTVDGQDLKIEQSDREVLGDLNDQLQINTQKESLKKKIEDKYKVTPEVQANIAKVYSAAQRVDEVRKQLKSDHPEYNNLSDSKLADIEPGFLAAQFNYENAYTKNITDYTDKLNKEVRNKNLLYSGNEVVISSKGKSESDQTVSLTTAMSRATSQSDTHPGTADDNAKKLIANYNANKKETNLTVSQGYDKIKKMYYYRISDGKTSGKIDVSQNDAGIEGFEDLSPHTTILSQRLMLNKGDNDYYSTSVGDRGLTPDDALELANDGKFEYRYNVKHTPKGFFVYLYKKDTDSEKDWEPVIDKTTNSSEWKAGNSQFRLDQIIQGLRNNYSK